MYKALSKKILGLSSLLLVSLQVNASLDSDNCIGQLTDCGPVSVPEPAVLPLLGSALVLMAVIKYKNRKK